MEDEKRRTSKINIGSIGRTRSSSWTLPPQENAAPSRMYNLAKFELMWDETVKKSIHINTNEKKKRDRSLEENLIENEAKCIKMNSKPSSEKLMGAKLSKLVDELAATTSKLQAEADSTTKKSIIDLVDTLSSIVSQIDIDRMRQLIKNEEVDSVHKRKNLDGKTFKQLKILI